MPANYYAPTGGHPPQTQITADRAVFTEAYALIPKGVMRDIVGSDLEPSYGPARGGDVPHSCASIERARRKLGFDPRVELREGLEQTLEWYRQRG